MHVLSDVNLAPSLSGDREHFFLKPITKKQGQGTGLGAFQWFSGRRRCKSVAEKGHEVWHAVSQIMSSFSLSLNVIVFLTLRSGLIEIKTFHCGTA